VATLGQLFSGRAPTPQERRLMAVDPRAGVRRLVAVLERSEQASRDEAARVERLTAYERPLWAAGLLRVGGCDEAGVSPLAGPLVAAAVVLHREDIPAGLDDSKKLTPARREALAEQIRARALAWGVGQAAPEEVDALNPYQAGLLAMRRAVEAMGVTPDHLLVDARRVPGVSMPQTRIIKGDALSVSIGAASIIAKTNRDQLMRELDARYPGYGLAEHKGYPVAAHVEALRRLGASPIHRRSFAPVREVLGLAPRQAGLFDPPAGRG